jgi:hypothetical protein
MVDAHGDPIAEGPYFCRSCQDGNLAVNEDHPDVVVVYCLDCDDIVHLQVL